MKQYPEPQTIPQYEWCFRSEEWIKSNPGQPTMYKHYADGYNPEAANRKEHKAVAGCKRGKVGVYIVLCEPAKHVYVGQSMNMSTRLRNHRWSITRNSNNKTYVQMREHLKQYGMDEFAFTMYAECDPHQRLDKEKEVMIEFIHKGYTLYNIALNMPNNIGNMIQCPVEIQDKVLAYISELLKD